MATIDTFKTRLRSLCDEQYGNAVRFAEALGEDARTVQTWLKPACTSFPRFYKIPTICRALNVSADYLFGVIDTPHPPAAAANTINGNGNIGTTTNNTTNANCRDCAALAALAATIRDLSSRLTP